MMALFDQQASSTYRRTWRFDLPKWLMRYPEEFTSRRGIYLTFSLGVKVRD